MRSSKKKIKEISLNLFKGVLHICCGARIASNAWTGLFFILCGENANYIIKRGINLNVKRRYSMKKYLIVVDMQNDFVSDALGSEDAKGIVENVKRRIMRAREEGEEVIFTRDTHDEEYLSSMEGKKLPVVHCIKGSRGYEIIDELKEYTHTALIIDKPTFGSIELGEYLARANEKEEIEKITLIGLCTDICVISNAMLIKANLPNVDIKVDASCCAGVSRESHENALNAMAVCHIDIIR